MSEVRDEAGLRTVALIGYGLFLFAPVNGVTAIAGVILAYLKRDEARGTIWEGHFRNMIVVFWVGAILAIAGLAIVMPGVATLLWSLAATNGNPPAALIGTVAAAVPILAAISLVFAIWYLTRTIGGFVRAIDARPY